MVESIVITPPTAQNPILTLGPNLFNWPVEEWCDFYNRIADEADIDVVYVGEVVCFRRAPFYMPHLDKVLARLHSAGKRIVASSLSLVMDTKDRNLVKEIIERDVLVEANDVSAMSHLAGKPHIVGPFVNIYNEGSMAISVANGATQACLPAEIPAATIETITKSTNIPIEVQVFGRIPLALSARCYHARAHHVHKDNCQYVCNLDPDGMDVNTLDGDPFLTVNGTQTMSYTYLNLGAEVSALRKMGVAAFRLWPHSVDMVQVAALYRSLLCEKIDATELASRLEKLMPDASFSNGFYYGKEGHHYIKEAV